MAKDSNDASEIVRFIHELGQLRRVKHEGLRLAGVEHPDSVAEHSLRAAQIGWLLAKLEGYKSPEKIASILVWHDVAECRIGDLHKVSRRYCTPDEERAVREQTAGLKEIGSSIMKYWKAHEHCEGNAGVIARDAGYLEMAFTAKQYVEQGLAAAQDWIENVSRAVKTESAKKLVAALRESASTDWWKGLKKLTA